MLTSNKRALAILMALASCGQTEQMPASSAADSKTSQSAEDIVNSTQAPEDQRLVFAFKALGQNDFKTCRKLAQAVLKDSPHHPRAELLLALGFQKSKRYAEALPLFRSAGLAEVDFLGKDAVPYYQAWCEFWLGDFEAARLSFKKHLAMEEEGDSYFGLGVIAIELGDFETAEVELLRALDRFKEEFDSGKTSRARELSKTRARLADIDLARGDDEGARAQLEDALKLDPSKPAVWFKLYGVAIDLDDSETAALAKSEYERLSQQVKPTSPILHGQGQ